MMERIRSMTKHPAWSKWLRRLAALMLAAMFGLVTVSSSAYARPGGVVGGSGGGQSGSAPGQVPGGTPGHGGTPPGQGGTPPGQEKKATSPSATTNKPLLPPGCLLGDELACELP